MAIIAKATGGAYCIDQAEISKGQYNKFITANVPISSQIALCQANTTFIPRGAWPPSTNEDPLPAATGLAFSFSLPVHYVDWCDAYAYCKWSGKQLCGQINGQGLDPTQRNDAGASAWYNACSAQGVKGWPYGVTFDDTFCNDHGSGSYGTNTNGGAPDAGNDPQWNCISPLVSYASTGCTYGQPGGVFQDDGVYAVVKSDALGNFTAYAHGGCQGGSVGLYQMSGNVAEWEDTCADGGPDAAAGPSQLCGLRGGSYTANGDANTLRCDAVRDEVRMPAAGAPDPLADVGIRCCVY
jgi:formylglycine-generating enzyme required for sulfatase activity